MDRPGLPSLLKRDPNGDMVGAIRDARVLQVNFNHLSWSWAPFDSGAKSWFCTDPSNVYQDQESLDCVAYRSRGKDIEVPRLRWTHYFAEDGTRYVASTRPPEGVTCGARSRVCHPSHTPLQPIYHRLSNGGWYV